MGLLGAHDESETLLNTTEWNTMEPGDQKWDIERVDVLEAAKRINLESI